MTGYEAVDLFGQNEKENKCVPYEQTITNVRLAHAYVPIQNFCTVYCPCDSLKNGTVFPDLKM